MCYATGDPGIHSIQYENSRESSTERADNRTLWNGWRRKTTEESQKQMNKQANKQKPLRKWLKKPKKNPNISWIQLRSRSPGRPMWDPDSVQIILVKKMPGYDKARKAETLSSNSTGQEETRWGLTASSTRAAVTGHWGAAPGTSRQIMQKQLQLLWFPSPELTSHKWHYVPTRFATNSLMLFNNHTFKGKL